MARWFFALFAAILIPASSMAQAPAPNDPQELVKQGRKLNSEGKQDEALALYQKALESSPNLYEAHAAAGVALDLKGEYDQARQHLAKAIEVAPPELKVQALRSMAISYAFERKATDAAKYEQQAFDSQMAAQNFTAAAEIANELARIYLESGDLDNAYQWYQKGHETAFKKPNMPANEKDLWDFRWEHAQARIAAHRGQKPEAQKHVAAAKAILDKGAIPEQTRFFPYLAGYVALYAGENKNAIADLQQADQRDPFILLLLARAYDKSGNKAQAQELYRKILIVNAHNPTNAFARPEAKKMLGSSS